MSRPARNFRGADCDDPSHLAADEPEWTWEERPVGEHDVEAVAFGAQSALRLCRHCGTPDYATDGPCLSRMIRRRVTPWEPVPSEGEAP